MLLSEIPETFQSDAFQTMDSYTEGGGKKIWPAVDMEFNYLQPICKFKTIAQKFKNFIKVFFERKLPQRKLFKNHFPIIHTVYTCMHINI